MDALYGRSAARWCDDCNRFGSHHTDKHQEMLAGVEGWLNSTLSEQVEFLSAADGVALMDMLRVPNAMYNASYQDSEKMITDLGALFPSNGAHLIFIQQIERAFDEGDGWVRVRDVLTKIKGAVPADKQALWSGWVPLNR